MSVVPRTGAPNLLVIFTFHDSAAGIAWQALDPTNRVLGDYGSLVFGVGLEANPPVWPPQAVAQFVQGRTDLTLDDVFSIEVAAEPTPGERNAAIRGYVWARYLRQDP